MFKLITFTFALCSILSVAHASTQTAVDAFERDSNVEARQQQLAKKGFVPAADANAVTVYYALADWIEVQHYLVTRLYKDAKADDSVLVAAYVELPVYRGNGRLPPRRTTVRLLDESALKSALTSTPAPGPGTRLPVVVQPPHQL